MINPNAQLPMLISITTKLINFSCEFFFPMCELVPKRLKDNKLRVGNVTVGGCHSRPKKRRSLTTIRITPKSTTPKHWLRAASEESVKCVLYQNFLVAEWHLNMNWLIAGWLQIAQQVPTTFISHVVPL